MKKIFLFVFIQSLMLHAFSQVNLEHNYSVPPGKQFYFTNLGNNNYKYVLIDYYNNKFSLYNLDHSPFIINIIPGVPLDSGVYDIAYITSTLFDCDSTNIEYVESSNGSTRPFYIFRTDGTLLFSKDSTLGPYCIGCHDGTIWLQPVFNTPIGTKMMLANLFTNDWSVYSLCGNLPETIIEIEKGNHYLQIYPNPSSGTITFQINTPSNIDYYELGIYNSSLQTMRIENLRGNKTLIIDDDKLSSGTYFFSLQTTNKIVQTGKFIISK